MRRKGVGLGAQHSIDCTALKQGQEAASPGFWMELTPPVSFEPGASDPPTQEAHPRHSAFANVGYSAFKGPYGELQAKTLCAKTFVSPSPPAPVSAPPSTHPQNVEEDAGNGGAPVVSDEQKEGRGDSSALMAETHKGLPTPLCNCLWKRCGWGTATS